METRANYVLIGAFALAGFFGLLAFLLWFASLEIDQQFDYYDVRFSSVSGLSRASEVRFAGLPVGQVVDVRLSPDNDGTVLTRIEISGDTPVRADSEATIESQGVTGVSFVGLSAGSLDAPLLDNVDGIPEIPSGRSVLQVLSEDAPDIVTEALAVMESIGEILNEENQRNIEQIITNLAESSGNLSQTLDDFTVVSQTIASASTDIAFFTQQIEPVVGNVEQTLRNVDTTLASFSQLSERLIVTLDEVDPALSSGRMTLDAASSFMTADLPGIVNELTATAELLRTQMTALTTDARGMIAEFTTTGTVATARLTEAEATLQSAEAAIAQLIETMETIDAAAVSFDGLVSNEGAALVAETRAMIDNADGAVALIAEVAENDLPTIVADIRSATGTANRVIAEVGEELTTTAGRFDGLAEDASVAMAQVTDTFANANDTLAAINTALSTGERTLAAAERAFDGADRVINEDIGTITTDLRGVMSRLDGAIAQVSEDIPEITADLRAAADSANATFIELGRIVSEAGVPVREFTTSGLTQYTQLARETRNLISSLEQLTRQIERDPARFFLNRQSPEFSR